MHKNTAISPQTHRDGRRNVPPSLKPAKKQQRKEEPLSYNRPNDRALPVRCRIFLLSEVVLFLTGEITRTFRTPLAGSLPTLATRLFVFLKCRKLLG